MPGGVTTLVDLAVQLPGWIEVSCDRRGKLRSARLVALHEPALPVPELRRILAAARYGSWIWAFNQRAAES